MHLKKEKKRKDQETPRWINAQIQSAIVEDWFRDQNHEE